MKKKTAALLLSLMALIVVAAGILAIWSVYQNKNQAEVESKTVDENGIRTFADWTEVETFHKVPAFISAETKIGEVGEYGDGLYVLDIQNSSMNAYKDYLKTLTKAGFKFYADNGENGIDEAVYTATYQKDKLVVTVTHVVATGKTYISADDNQPLSEHLFYKEEYIAQNKDGAKTVLHMPELYSNGNSFILQLKNGHFILNDGGMTADVYYLLDYLETLVPENEKPIIDAWIISHAHGDHMGVMQEIVAKKKDFVNRFYVEGVYFNEPSKKIFTEWDPESMGAAAFVKGFAQIAKTTTGEHPLVYRPQAGQRYYFNDVVIEIPYSQELLVMENYRQNINESSTWCMYHIDGQKFLLAGDADLGGIEAVMEIYESKYFDMDIFSVFHHGINVWDKFTDYCKFDTLLYTSWRQGSIWVDEIWAGRPQENEYMRKAAKEVYHYGDGGNVLTFPYQVGTAKKLPLCDWRYHEGKCNRTLNGAME